MKESRGKYKACPIMGQSLKAAAPINYKKEFFFNSHFPEIAISSMPHKKQIETQTICKIQ